MGHFPSLAPTIRRFGSTCPGRLYLGLSWYVRFPQLPFIEYLCSTSSAYMPWSFCKRHFLTCSRCLPLTRVVFWVCFIRCSGSAMCSISMSRHYLIDYLFHSHHLLIRNPNLPHPTVVSRSCLRLQLIRHGPLGRQYTSGATLLPLTCHPIPTKWPARIGGPGCDIYLRSVCRPRAPLHLHSLFITFLGGILGVTETAGIYSHPCTKLSNQ